MIIRRAEKKDIDGINSLLRQVLYVHHTGRPDIFKAEGKKYTDEQLCDIIDDDTTPVFVAAGDEGEILGHCFCMLSEHRGHSALMDIKSLYIDDLCIDERSRGQGVGMALYEHTLSYARSIGCYNVTLNVWAENSSALEFYKSMGMSVQKIGMEKIL